MKNLPFLLLLMSLPAFLPTALAQSDRPNIIFLLTDDQRWDALGHAGNAIIQTPEMDRLARQGCYFENAFVTTPICAASRASIITGRYERSHGYTFGQPPLDSATLASTYFALLKQAGYHTGFLGKLGMAFQNRLDTALFDVYRPERTDFYWRLTEGATRHRHLTDLMGDYATAFIEQAPNDQPFCLSVSYNAPHAEDRSPDQYIWPAELDTLYNGAHILPPALGEEAFFEMQPEYVRQGFNRVRWQWRFNSPEKYQKMVKGYYRMLTAVDRTIGRIRQALQGQGLVENTIIILAGDNGYFLGERQFAGKWLMYEQSLRVPLVVYDPRQSAPRQIADPALNIDIAPTILEFAGVDVPESMQGSSMAGYAQGRNPLAQRQYFLCEHLWDFAPIPASEGVRGREWKYFRYRDDPAHEELYHLASDPLETRNLADSASHQPQLRKMREQLATLVSEAGEE